MSQMFALSGTRWDLHTIEIHRKALMDRRSVRPWDFLLQIARWWRLGLVRGQGSLASFALAACGFLESPYQGRGRGMPGRGRRNYHTNLRRKKLIRANNVLRNQEVPPTTVKDLQSLHPKLCHFNFVR